MALPSLHRRSGAHMAYGAGVVTAMVGHFTAYGIGKKNFSAKLKDKNSQRIAMAEKLLERERAKEAAKANVA